MIGLLGFTIALLARLDGRGELSLLTIDQILAQVGQITDRLFSARGQIGCPLADLVSGVTGVIKPFARRVGKFRTKLAAREQLLTISFTIVKKKRCF